MIIESKKSHLANLQTTISSLQLNGELFPEKIKIAKIIASQLKRNNIVFNLVKK